MPHFLNENIDTYFVDEGDPNGPPIVFANSLGTNLHLWDSILPLLPDGLRLIRYDMRGHGRTTVPEGPYSMGQLISDVERLLEHLNVTECMFVGLSIGGMIAQGLASKRLDLVRCVVLSNTAAKIGTRDMWADRIATIQNGGIEALADAVMERWFSKSFRASPELNVWRHMLVTQSSVGYIGCSSAIAGTDFLSTTSALRLPALAIAGSEDGATPPDLVLETAGLIPGSDFRLIRGVGHLPCVEAPQKYAQALTEFIYKTGTLPSSPDG